MAILLNSDPLRPTHLIGATATSPLCALRARGGGEVAATAENKEAPHRKMRGLFFWQIVLGLYAPQFTQGDLQHRPAMAHIIGPAGIRGLGLLGKQLVGVQRAGM